MFKVTNRENLWGSKIEVNDETAAVKLAMATGAPIRFSEEQNSLLVSCGVAYGCGCVINKTIIDPVLGIIGLGSWDSLCPECEAETM